MKNIFIVFILAFYSVTTQAQPIPEVTISTEKVIFNGKKFYLHTVQPKQTLYSLSKAYNVTIEDITTNNPSIAVAGLTIGSVVKIPVVAEPDVVELKEGDKYIYHIIQDNETLYSLSKKYGVDIKIIEKNNPEVLHSALQINQVIKIPRKKISESIPLNDSTAFISHTVARKETLYSLARIYGVTEKQITDANPTLPTDGLRIDDEIKIPNSGFVATITSKKETIVNVDIDYTPVFNCAEAKNKKQLAEINIGILLPFYLKENSESFYQRIKDDSTNKRNNPVRTPQKYNDYVFYKSSNSLEFYEGVLIALEDFKKEGVKVNLKVFDSEQDSNTVKKLAAKGSFDSLHFILGPAYTYNVDVLTRYTDKKEIPVITPFSSSSQVLAGKQNVFQANPSDETVCLKILDFAKKNDTSSNVIMIYDTHIADYDLVDIYRKNLRLMFPKEPTNALDTIAATTVPELELNDKLRDKLIAKFDTGKVNIIVVPTEREAMLNNVLSTLNTLNRDFKIQIIGLPEWAHFQNIDIEDYFNLELVCATPYFLDFESPSLNNFVKKYRKLYNTDIFTITSDGYNFSVLGYDLTTYFIYEYLKYQENFKYCLNEASLPTIQTKFKFVKISPESGYENRSINFIRYNKNFSITKIK